MKWNFKNFINKETINKTTHVIAQTCQKHAPAALTILACAGVVATGYLVAEAKPKADEAIDLMKVDKASKNEEVKKTDIVLAAAPSYAKAACAGALTIGCIIGSNRLQAKKVESLMAAYNVTQTLYSEYKDKFENIATPEEVKQASNEIVKTIDEKHPVSSAYAVKTGQGDILCKDFCTGQLFYSDPDYILKRVVYWNYRLQQDDVVTLDDILWDLTHVSSDIGMSYGWDITQGQKIECNFNDTGKTLDNVPYVVVKLNAHPIM